MKTFVDNAGRTWTVQINVDAIKRVRDLAKVDLLEVVEGKLIERLIGDPVLLCDVLYCVCKPEADAQSINDSDFGRSMGGDAIDGGTAALLEELVSFFPQGRRKVLAKAMEKLAKFEATVLAAVEAKLESPELEKSLATELQRIESGSSSGNAPGLSEWSPVI